jgi:hypothetical protein
MKRHEQIQIKARAVQIAVSVPFCEEFNTAARQLGGKFDRATTAWILDQRHEDRIRERLIGLFGTDGQPVETVTIEINLDLYPNPDGSADSLRIGGWELLKKRYRDSAPALNGCAAIAGQLHSSGGSRNNPRITWEPGTVIEATQIPASLIDAMIAYGAEGITITERQPLEPESPEAEPQTTQAERLSAMAEAINELDDPDDATAAAILAALGRIMATGNGNGPSAPEIVLAALLNYEIDIVALIAEVDTAA